MSWSKLRRFGLTLLIFDAVVVVGCVALAALLGAFNRTAIGFLILVVAGTLMLGGPVLMGGLPMQGPTAFGGDTGLNYTNTLHTEMLLQQSLRDEHVAADLRKRRRPGLTLLASGFSLLFVAMAVIG